MKKFSLRQVLVFIIALLLLTCTSVTQQQNINAEYRSRAAQIAASMDKSTLVAQVFLTAVEGKDNVPERTRQLLARVPAGGIILFGYNISSPPEKTGVFIEELYNCIDNVSLPPFVASDQEGGLVQRFQGRAALPPPLSYWENLSETDQAAVQGNSGNRQVTAAMKTAFLEIEQDAAGAAQELRRIGITLNLAPLAELLTTENRTFLKTRSYGPNPAFVAGAASAFIRGMQRSGVAATLKHFPGNSAADPHKNRSLLSVSAAELQMLLEPFAETIRIEMPAAVMLSHVIVPSWSPKPSSLSSHAVQQLREMGFTGIIMTDDLAMAAAGSPVEICAVEALAAGADMILVWPGDLLKTQQAILTALNTGRLSEKRIREAAEHIIYQKIRYKLIL